MKIFLVLLLSLLSVAFVLAQDFHGGNNIETLNNPIDIFTPYASNWRRRCPLCDSSVCGYCGAYLFHDSCCCRDHLYDDRPYQCEYADCSFLHANSCKEHKLITACCCTNSVCNRPYFSK